MYNVVICLRKENLATLGKFSAGTFFKIPFVPIVYEDEMLSDLEHFNLKSFSRLFITRPFVVGGKVGSFACFGCAAGFEGQANVPMRVCLLCPRGMVHNAWL